MNNCLLVFTRGFFSKRDTYLFNTVSVFICIQSTIERVSEISKLVNELLSNSINL